jgi:sialate O-acetylesterase
LRGFKPFPLNPWIQGISNENNKPHKSVTMKTTKSTWASRAAILGVALLVFLSTSASAALSVSPIFNSNMVLQRNTTVPVFGTADPGATVIVQFQSQNKSVVADASGKWRVDLNSMPASSAPSSMFVSSGSSSATFTGVQVGEVWLCSGQSNMGRPLSSANGSAPYIADAGNHNIRLFKMIAGNPPSGSSWQVSSSTTADDFSAVGYWMGYELSRWLGNIPVGLIQATHDGTSISQWSHLNGGNGSDYDAMVKAIQPFAIKGAAWYQGESDAGDAPATYEAKLTDMINEWRSDWGLANLPFGIVQLAGTAGSSSSGGARLAQLHVTLNVPNTFLAVSSDLPGGNQLHPSEKKPIGIRLGLGARATVYGDNIEYSGPVRADSPASYVSGNTIILNFAHLGNGLVTGNGLAPGPLTIAGASGSFASANAVIVGNTIHVSSSQVSAPTRVKYQFGSTGNLFNSVNIPVEGGSATVTMLPASMFLLNVTGGGGSCTASSMAVASIVKGTWNAGQGKKGGSAQVTILNNCGNPVSGATVTGTFTGDFNETRSAVTGSNGVATLNTVGSKSGGVSITFCVDNVTGGLPYNSGNNVVTCQ